MSCNLLFSLPNSGSHKGVPTCLGNQGTGLDALALHCRLRTQRGAGLFKQWDSLASALRPLLLLDCDEECPIDWDAVDRPPFIPPGSSTSGTSSTSGSGAAAVGSREPVPEGCRLVMPSQAELSAAEDGGQLVKAVHVHGGLVEVARRLGASVRKG